MENLVESSPLASVKKAVASRIKIEMLLTSFVRILSKIKGGLLLPDHAGTQDADFLKMMTEVLIAEEKTTRQDDMVRCNLSDFPLYDSS
ncbi:hypothetical protein AVEN_176584-1 [Araneus ventricosus]|uniref:Uncharacterized protein n=1 Tax=Araneus ventricosus TaxID=182803 RepID=A0A4Y2M160_ARAVE|nr:hypothetical protein AVEN_176584-1 [Araneus ventricosus]